jgi:hypothetical protein
MSATIAAIGSGVGRRAEAAPQPVEAYAALGAASGLDSNVHNGNGPDLVNRLEPQVGLRLALPRLSLSANYEADYLAYTLGKASNSWNHTLASDLDASITPRLALHGHQVFIDAADPAAVNLATPVLVSGNIVSEDAAVQLTYNLTERLTIAPSYGAHLLRFSGADARFDSTQQWPSLMMGYQVTHLDTIHVGDAQGLFSGPGASGWSNEPLAGLTHVLGPRSDVSGAGGPVFFVTGGHTAPTWHAAAAIRYEGRRYRTAALYSRDLLAGGAAQTLWAETVSLQLTLLLSRAASLRLYAVGYRSGYAPDDAAFLRGVAGEGEVDWLIGHGLSVGAYTLAREQEIVPGATGPFIGASRFLVGLRVLGVVGADVHDLLEVP